VAPTTMSGGSGSATRNSAAPAARVTCVTAALIWHDHQTDRAWIEYGLRWPPLSVRRPRCLTCLRAWPCPDALAAHEHLTNCEKHRDSHYTTSDDR